MGFKVWFREKPKPLVPMLKRFVLVAFLTASIAGAVNGQRTRWAFVAVQPESISPDGPVVTMRDDGSVYLVRLINTTAPKNPLSTRKAEAWLLRADGTVARKTANGTIPDPVGNAAPVDTLVFSFEHIPRAALRAVVVSLDGSMTVHKVLPP